MQIRLQPRKRPQVAAAAPDAHVMAFVEKRWCQLRNTVQSMAMDVLGHARRPHQDWFGENDATISNLFSVNRLHKASTALPKATFYRSRRIVPQRLRDEQDA
nr:unnamed protein product [Spirometra erinaceieuropaei]